MELNRVLIEAVRRQERVRAAEARVRHPLAHVNLLRHQIVSVDILERLDEEVDDL